MKRILCALLAMLLLVSLSSGLTLRARADDEVVIDGVVYTEGGTYLSSCPENYTGVLTIPKIVTGVNTWSLAQCPGITAFAVAEGNTKFTALEGSLFSKDLTALYANPKGRSGRLLIPKQTVYVSDYVFYYNRKVTAYEVEAQNPRYQSENGLLYSKNMRRLISVPGAKSGSIVVSDQAYAMDPSAMQWMDQAESLTVPNVVRFYGAGGSRLKTLILGPGVIDLQYFYIESLPSLERVRVEAKEILFSNSFPFRMLEIGPDCTMFWREPETGVLYSRDKTVLYIAPESLSGHYAARKETQETKAGAFSGCTRLTGLEFSSNLVRLGSIDLGACTALKTLVVPNRTVRFSFRVGDNAGGITLYTPKGSTLAVHGADQGLKVKDISKWSSSAYASSSAPVETGFQDVPPTSWYAAPVKAAADRGLMVGTGDDCFSPKQSMSRAMYVTVLYSLAGKPEVPEDAPVFTDVPENAWYTRPVRWAASVGVTSGTGNGTFSPNAAVTRQQIAVMTAGWLRSTGAELIFAAGERGEFCDWWRVSAYAVKDVELMHALGIFNGDSSNNFNPTSSCTRAEGATILVALCKMLDGEQLCLSSPTYPLKEGLTAAQKAEEARKVAQAIANSIPRNLTDLERVSRAALIVASYSSKAIYGRYEDYTTAYGVFLHKHYTCQGSTDALGMVLNCMGYSYVHVNKGQNTHQWNELIMDGKKGFADGMGGFANYGDYSDGEESWAFASPRDYALDVDLLISIGEQTMAEMGPAEFDRELSLEGYYYGSDYDVLMDNCLAPSVEQIRAYVRIWVCENAAEADLSPEEFLNTYTFRVAVFPNEDHKGSLYSPVLRSYIVKIVWGPEKGN